jgi:hypothetical protein
VAADPELAGFIEDSSGRHEFYVVHLAVSFSAFGRPRLRSAKVELNLASVPDVPEPFALSLDPLAAGHAAKVDKKLRILPSVKVPGQVELGLGDYEQSASYERTDRFVRGVGLDGARPGWEFTRTQTAELDGAHRLVMIVQAGCGAAVSVTGRVTARVAGNIGWRFGGALPNPLHFAAVV